MFFSSTGLTTFTVATITNSFFSRLVDALRKKEPKIGTSPNNGTLLMPSTSFELNSPPIIKLSPLATSNRDLARRVSN